MKTLKPFVTSIAFSAVVAIVGVLTLNSPALAQEKGAELLTKSQRSTVAADVQKAGAVKPMAMPCAKCKDTLVSVAQPAGRGGRVEMATVTQHQCPTCSTKTSTVGVGKQATTSVKHTCSESAAGNSACCAMKSQH